MSRSEEEASPNASDPSVSIYFIVHFYKANIIDTDIIPFNFLPQVYFLVRLTLLSKHELKLLGQKNEAHALNCNAL